MLTHFKDYDNSNRIQTEYGIDKLNGLRSLSQSASYLSLKRLSLCVWSWHLAVWPINQPNTPSLFQNQSLFSISLESMLAIQVWVQIVLRNFKALTLKSTKVRGNIKYQISGIKGVSPNLHQFNSKIATLNYICIIMQSIESIWIHAVYELNISKQAGPFVLVDS